MGAFKAWETSRQDLQVHALIRYLVDWVAGTNLIFLVLVFAFVGLAAILC